MLESYLGLKSLEWVWAAIYWNIFNYIDSIIHKEETTGRTNITALVNWFGFDNQLPHSDCLISFLLSILYHVCIYHEKTW